MAKCVLWKRLSRSFHTAEVAGSSPASPTIFRLPRESVVADGSPPGLREVRLRISGSARAALMSQGPAPFPRGSIPTKGLFTRWRVLFCLHWRRPLRARLLGRLGWLQMPSSVGCSRAIAHARAPRTDSGSRGLGVRAARSGERAWRSIACANRGAEEVTLKRV